MRYTDQVMTEIPEQTRLIKILKLISLPLVVILAMAGFFIFFNQTGAPTKTIADPSDFIDQSANEISEKKVVKPELSNVTSLTPICEGAENTSFPCYENFYEGLVKHESIPFAFADIKVRAEENSYVKSQCHPITHSIGHAAAEIYPDILDAFSHGDSYCWSGYYHGLLEEIIDRKGTEKTLAELNTICSRIPGKDVYSFDYYNCVHGLGHGLMGSSGQNLFEALVMCDNLSGEWERLSCYGGVFMENIIIENKGGSTAYLKASDPVYPCNAVGERYKQICYLMQTSYMLKVSDYNFSTVFDLCSKVEGVYKATCYQSLGRDASGNSSSNKDQTQATCYLGRDFDQRSNCIIGAVKDFVSYYHDNTEANNLCNSLTPDLSTMCLDTVASYYQTFQN